MCTVIGIGKIYDYQRGVPGSVPGLVEPVELLRLSFATLSVERNVKPLTFYRPGGRGACGPTALP